ncbi:metallophosphoesterase family protein [Ilumatobacter nonamiensis]|uniref:metallophosphoesterase family protein n=1 Tax=Ilumatobacter nonamiensis TaxID=467093 RepID=UPI000345CCB9|nr:metallophosphoesterase [Ilumatobacter nonamiensis]
MRYLVASDLHYALPQLDWIADQAADFDAVILAGDHLDAAGRADMSAQVALTVAFLGRLAETTKVIVNSGNHDLIGRREDGEKAAIWLSRIDHRVSRDGDSFRSGDDMITACAWWEGPATRGELEHQLAAAAESRPPGRWIWVYHSPPDRSPTSWSGHRHYGDDVLNGLIDMHQPDIVLTGHVHEAPFRPDGSWHDRIGDTLVLNAGRQPGPIPAHLIVDTTTDEVDWWTFEGNGTIPL